MSRHFIIMSSSYTDGTRVALDITGKEQLTSEVISQIIDQIQQSCGKDVPLSTHFIETKDPTWASVSAYDPFFSGVECVQTVATFIEKIKKSRVLSGLDVANYILAKIRCTHLSLEKLVYFAYADYLCKYSDRLFDDQVYAFTFGPVVSSVYETYKRSGPHPVVPISIGADRDVQCDVKELPARSRILFAKDGAEKLQSIDETIGKYGGYSAKELVDITHRTGSPWSRVDSSKAYQVISDELIIAYHHVECV